MSQASQAAGVPAAAGGAVRSGRRRGRVTPRRPALALATAAALAAAAAALGPTAPALAAAPAPAAASGETITFSAAETRRILQHGPWPAPPAADPSNRVSGDPAAMALGHQLFFDPRLSADGRLSCATCHDPARAWTDGRPRAMGLAPLDRNTPTVLDVAQHRWFFWDGRADSLWAQSIQPIVDAREMGASPGHVAALVRGDARLACLYAAAFRQAPSSEAGEDRVFVNAAKALAAFVERLGSGRTPFDEFRDALARGDQAAAARYPAPAQRGLRIFVGRGNCSLCHFGPAFTNGEFHDVGVPFMAGPGRVDAGRHQGIRQLKADRFNLLGPFSDDDSRASAVKTRTVEIQHANFGQFKTPGLRNVALTGPYMHDGRYAALRDVVRHYSDLDMERIHTHGEQLLRPLKLSVGEIDDLVAFLESLTAPGATALPAPPAPVAACP
jgi:cytochrome c peroxidase